MQSISQNLMGASQNMTGILKVWGRPENGLMKTARDLQNEILKNPNAKAKTAQPGPLINSDLIFSNPSKVCGDRETINAILGGTQMYKDEKLLGQKEKETMLEFLVLETQILNIYLFFIDAGIRPPQEVIRIALSFAAREGFAQEELDDLKEEALRLPKTKHSFLPPRNSENIVH